MRCLAAVEFVKLLAFMLLRHCRFEGESVGGRVVRLLFLDLGYDDSISEFSISSLSCPLHPFFIFSSFLSSSQSSDLSPRVAEWLDMYRKYPISLVMCART